MKSSGNNLQLKGGQIILGMCSDLIVETEVMGEDSRRGYLIFY